MKVLAVAGCIAASVADADDGTASPATARDTATTVTGTPTVIYETGFTGGLPTSGWTVVDGGDSTGDSWTSTNPGGRSNENWTGTFMIADSDYFGYFGYGVMDEQLVTDSIDCSNYANVILKFKHYFSYWSGGLNEICDVDVRVDGGPWQNIASYQGQDASGQVELSLSSIADGQADVQIRWHYYNADFEYYWGIDDVEITGAVLPERMLGDFEPDCDVDLDDLAVLTLAWLSSEGGENWNPACDIHWPADNAIDFLDFAVFAESWLTGVE